MSHERLNDDQRRMVEDNINLVHYAIKKNFFGITKSYDDYFQEGCIGLCQAALRFDPDLGYKFSTYALLMIIGTIKRYRRDNTSLIHYPRKFKDLKSKLFSYMSSKGYTEISEMTDEDFRNLEQDLDISRYEYYDIWNSSVMNSLDNKINGKDGSVTEFYETLSDSRDYMDEIDTQSLFEESMNSVLRRINDTYKDIFEEWIYAKINGDDLKQKYLADKYKISQPQIARIIKRCKDLLAQSMGYEEYMSSKKGDKENKEDETEYIVRNGKLKSVKKSKRIEN